MKPTLEQYEYKQNNSTNNKLLQAKIELKNIAIKYKEIYNTNRECHLFKVFLHGFKLSLIDFPTGSLLVSV